MLDASTFTLGLTFAGTLGIAFLLFIGQVLSFTVLLCLAAATQLLTALFGALRPSGDRKSSRGLHH